MLVSRFDPLTARLSAHMTLFVRIVAIPEAGMGAEQIETLLLYHYILGTTTPVMEKHRHCCRYGDRSPSMLDSSSNNRVATDNQRARAPSTLKAVVLCCRAATA